MTDETSEVEFFGARIKVKSARLAALLNSDVTDDVVVVGKRAVDLVVVDDGTDDDSYAAEETPESETDVRSRLAVVPHVEEDDEAGVP